MKYGRLVVAVLAFVTVATALFEVKPRTTVAAADKSPLAINRRAAAMRDDGAPVITNVHGGPLFLVLEHDGRFHHVEGGGVGGGFGASDRQSLQQSGGFADLLQQRGRSRHERHDG